MKTQCLMFRTPNGCKYFTSEDSFLQLVEIARTLQAEIAVVRTENPNILDLENLAAAMCRENYPATREEIEILEIKLSPRKPRKNRNAIRAGAQSIRNYIRERLFEKRAVSLKDLRVHFQNMDLTSACLCQHFRHVRVNLANEGHRIKKLGAGKYLICS